MDLGLDEVVSLKRQPFNKRIEMMTAFLDEQRKSGGMLGMMGKMGFPPVGPKQVYQNPMNGEDVEVLMFGSNSYLGLSDEPEIKEKVKKTIDKFGLGNGGSPAFSGYTFQQKNLEARLSGLSGHNDAMLVAGGYIANLTWINGLIEKDDILIYDKNSHASTLDAIKLAEIKHAYLFNPSKLETLKAAVSTAVKKYPDSKIFITVEGVHSIDGSITDLRALLDVIAEDRERIFLMLDDAHGLGTLGKKGHGTLEHFDLKGKVDLRMSTCSKAMGIQGAFLTGDSNVLNYIRTVSNPYTFTTSMSQPVIAAIDAALDFMEEHPERIEQLHINKRYLQDALEGMGFNIFRSESAIIPIFVKGAPCEEINRELFIRGIFANVFFYPLISPGQERIRLSVMATHTREHMDSLLTTLKDIGKQYNIID
jgi:glycine C-acetyltransferase